MLMYVNRVSRPNWYHLRNASKSRVVMPKNKVLINNVLLKKYGKKWIEKVYGNDAAKFIQHHYKEHLYKPNGKFVKKTAKKNKKSLNKK